MIICSCIFATFLIFNNVHAAGIKFLCEMISWIFVLVAFSKCLNFYLGHLGQFFFNLGLAWMACVIEYPPATKYVCKNLLRNQRWTTKIDKTQIQLRAIILYKQLNVLMKTEDILLVTFHPPTFAGFSVFRFHNSLFSGKFQELRFEVLFFCSWFCYSFW